MRRAAELCVFVVVAAALHLGVVVLHGEQEAGAVASGEGGEALISLQASSAQVATMVEQWERPPEVTSTPEDRQAPPTPEVAALPEARSEAPERQAPAPDLPDIEVPTVDAPDMPAAPPPPQPVALSEPEAPPEPETPEPQAVAEPEALPEPRVETAAPDTSVRPPERPEREVAEPQPQQQATPAERQQTASPSSAAQRAAGSGGGTSAGAGSRQSAALSNAERQTLMSRWGAAIRARVERRKQYPRAARGVSGTVRVTLRVGADGSLQALGLAASSGNAALDQAAVAAVRRAGRFPAAPDGLTGGSHTFTLPMAFGG